MRFTFIILLSSIVGCSLKGTEKENADQRVDVLQIQSLKVLLGKEIEEIRKMKYVQEVEIVDTSFEAEDGIDWQGLVFYLRKSKLLHLEANWQRRNVVSRIVVLGTQVSSSNNIQIGSLFKDIKEKLSAEIPSYPDGYFALRDLTDSSITYFFYVEPESAAALGDITFDAIPDDCRVSEIIVE